MAKFAKGGKVSRVVGPLDRALRRGGLKAGLILQRRLAVTLSQPGHGRIYKRGQVLHRASSPGEPPAPDSGELRGSVQVIDKTTTRAVRIRIVVRAKHARPQELGGRHRAPRPFFRPSVELSRGSMRRAIRGEILAVIRVP